ncbi:MAG: hypothetical protein MUO63_20885 [Desulfobulbaceae bacterium]|nr:hypothetical protein [Desulfobulbaceae bacterium]
MAETLLLLLQAVPRCQKEIKLFFPGDFDPFFIGRPDLLLTWGGACKLKLLDNVKVHGKVLSR